MFKEFIPSIKAHFNERLSNPILGAFSFSWILFNWKIVLVLLFSKKTVEEKISIIESDYLNLFNSLLFPALFVVFYLLIVPWLSLGAQTFQEKANKRRRHSKIESDTADFKARHELLTAQTEYEKIQFEYDLFKEMERKRRDFEIEQEKAPHEIRMAREKHQLEVEFNELKENAEHSAKMRNLDIEERRRNEELNHELQRKRQEADIEMQQIRENAELKRMYGK